MCEVNLKPDYDFWVSANSVKLHEISSERCENAVADEAAIDCANRDCRIERPLRSVYQIRAYLFFKIQLLFFDWKPKPNQEKNYVWIWETLEIHVNLWENSVMYDQYCERIKAMLSLDFEWKVFWIFVQLRLLRVTYIASGTWWRHGVGFRAKVFPLSFSPTSGLRRLPVRREWFSCQVSRRYLLILASSGVPLLGRWRRADVTWRDDVSVAVVAVVSLCAGAPYGHIPQSEMIPVSTKSKTHPDMQLLVR